MAIEKVIDIVVNTDAATSGINEISKSFDKLKKTAEELEKEIEKTTDPEKLAFLKKQLADVNKELGKTSEGFKKTTKSASGLDKIVKGIGTSLKALGVGLLIGLLAKLSSVFTSNDKVVNAFNTTMIFLEKVFSDFFSVVFKGGEKWVKFIKESFENPKKTLKEFGESLQKNIEERIKSAVKVVGSLSSAIGKLVNLDFSGALEQTKNAGKEMLDVATGVNDSYEKGTELLKEGAEAITDYAKETADAAKEVNNLRKNFELLENQQIRVKEAADRDAERQRQIRDDYTKPITERMEADRKLIKIINLQEKAEKASVQARISGLQQEQALLGFKQERFNEIYKLQTELLAIEAQQEGFRSEQELNRLALQRELVELGLTEDKAIIERQIKELEFNAEQEKAELNKIELLKNSLKIQQEELEKDIEYKRGLYLEETQERVDAEQEYLNLKQELAQKEIELEGQKTAKLEEIRNIEKEAEEKRKEDQFNFDVERQDDEIKKIELLKERLEIERQTLEEDFEQKREMYQNDLENRIKAEQEYLTAKQELAQREIEIEENLRKEKAIRQEAVSNAVIDTTRNTLAVVEQIQGEGSKIGKKIAVAQTTISAIEGTANAFKTAQGSPVTKLFPAYPFIQAGIAAAFGFAQVQKIKNTDLSGSSGGGGSIASAGSGGGLQAPSFNLVQGTGTNQIADSINNQDKPIKAFVVSSEVSSQQELDRKTVQTATL